MFDFLLSMVNILPQGLRKALGAAVVALTGALAVIWYGATKKREGASEAVTDALVEDTKKLEKSREAAYKEKRDVNGISTSDLVDRLRRRDDDWGGL